MEESPAFAPAPRSHQRADNNNLTGSRLHTLLRGNSLRLGDAHELMPLRLDWRRKEVVFAIRVRPNAGHGAGHVSSATIDCPGHYVSGRGECLLMLERKAGKSFLVNRRYRVQVLQVLSHSVRILVDEERSLQPSRGAIGWFPKRRLTGIA
ncbi:hypothetical protein Mal64_07520 [Pseudobythopirellula maris]|uniref:Uncharacterized protein n=1 Tax=Pseudobythopirellula maris TaxID=2527991 RepID=A0A5C5ZVU7_9BACT|nr:hypothetical protein [Pseudobythopirellula maris]TWT90363.1 hypothetical protein Mal64_07520 [Pseudobythopirellula maris]